jgi:FlaA1/EpsC-like NDP-sugar epimerase/dTDP-4-amino-4,6-dideoxygalactose transaminase/lipopolysaccharide/colanic/teichoic acid biosynthesis glycosyltransferase
VEQHAHRTVTSGSRMHSARLAFLFLQRRIGADTLAWTAGLLSALVLRYDFQAGRISWLDFGLLAAAAAVVQVLVGVATGLYLGRWRLGSFDEVSALVRTVAGATSLLFLVELRLPHRFVPLSVVVGGGVIAFVLMGAARYLVRSYDEERRRPTGPDVHRLLVFGAGEAGAQIVASLLRDPASPYLPVALLDDDPTKRHLRIMGVPVMGDRTRMAEAADEHQADSLLVALPSASAALLRELSDLAHDAGLDVKVLPGVGELVGGHIAVGDIRTPTAEDLLGRHPVDTDVASIAHYLRGKRILVTGAGGSIGSELCRQIAQFEPANLIMVDRDESALHAVQLSIEGRALLDSPDLVLLDLRDQAGMERLLRQRRPEVIFHAAALKHLPLLERYPGEAVQSNVWVTAHLLAAAADVGVEKFVNISTDKAADPISVLGYSKRVAERLTAHYAEHASGSFVSVRFGNVLGSRGSVLHAFRAQIEAGGPVTVTDPNVTRYFMTVHEAVQLVIQSAAVNGEQPPNGDEPGTATSQCQGEALVLDMGEPMLLDDVARRLIAESGRDVKIVYTGLRPGEKLHEDLFGQAEHVVRRVHPLISHVHVPPLQPGTVKALDLRLPAAAIRAELEELCRESMPDIPALPPTFGIDNNPDLAADAILSAALAQPPVPHRAAAAPRTSSTVPSARHGRSRRAVPERPPRRRGISLFTPLCSTALKRAIDVLVAASGLILGLPVLVIVAGLVRLRMGSPVLFRQCRLGRHAQSFKLVKFRTMTDERDEEGRPLPDGQRLTRLGRVLRCLSLDELPQLWNVLLGEMSLVGPRPLPVTYVRRYTPSEYRRHTVRPGLTGWAQVNGRNNVGWEERFALDVWYIEHRSCLLDLRILGRTLVALARRHGISAQGEATMAELRPPIALAGPAPAIAPAPALAFDRSVPAEAESAEQSRIWLSPPDVRAPERAALLAALESGWVAPVGPDLDAFEAELAERCGVSHSVALSSGTAALHLALLQVGVSPGDDVLVPTATFAATANAVTYCGARPCFIDADPVTWQISPTLLAAELAERRDRGSLPAAVVTVDLYGACADYDAILARCSEYGVPVVEDAAEALGATFRGRPAGSFGTAGVLSFNGNKIITTSSGGALLCHDGDAADRARYLATQARRPVAHYEHTEVGFNYRLSNLLAAFGRGQLATLEERIARRRTIQARYHEAFADVPGLSFPVIGAAGTTNAWLTCITLQPGMAALGPDQLRAELEAHNIETRPLWKPMHAQPVFRHHPARLDGTADGLFATGLCLPSGSGMSDGDLDRVVEAVRGALTRSRPAEANTAGWGPASPVPTASMGMVAR